MKKVNLLDGWKNIGLTIVISVCSNTKVHLLGVGVFPPSLGDTKDGIRRTHLHSRPEGCIPDC